MRFTEFHFQEVGIYNACLPMILRRQTRRRVGHGRVGLFLRRVEQRFVALGLFQSLLTALRLLVEQQIEPDSIVVMLDDLVDAGSYPVGDLAQIVSLKVKARKQLDEPLVRRNRATLMREIDAELGSDAVFASHDLLEHIDGRVGF